MAGAMKAWPRRQAALGLVLFSSCAGASAGDALRSAVAKLAASGEVSCRPTLPFFCSNMHVSCAGLTSVATFPFKLRATAVLGMIEAAPGTESLRGAYENGRVEWDPAGTYVIVLPSSGGGYVKLLADGSYSFRHYAQHGAAMSLGRCE